MIKVFVIDDHAVVRAGLKAMLPMEGDMEVIGEAADGEGAALAAIASNADVILLDIRMPGKDGLEVLKEIRAASPTAKVVMLTTSEADNDVYEAVKSGAQGYVVKDRDAGEIYAAVRRVASGGKYFPADVHDLYMQREMMEEFTVREREVLEEIAKGFSHTEIAMRLNIAPDTVKKHIKSVYSKLGVSDRVTAVSEGYRRGFLRMEK